MEASLQSPPHSGYQLIANLPVVSLTKLYRKDALECDILQNVCSTLGFFYLDLEDHPDLLLLWKKLLGFSQAYLLRASGPSSRMITRMNYTVR